MIREIKESEIAECVRVIRESFLTIADELGFTIENAPRFTAFAATEERLRWQFKQEHRPMFVCCDKDTIVGYYSLALQENHACEINNLCVIPGYRHKGIGAELLKSAFEEARKRSCSKINIGIAEENKILRKWYEAYGFIHTGTKKFDFFPFTCGYMEKNLKMDLEK